MYKQKRFSCFMNGDRCQQDIFSSGSCSPENKKPDIKHNSKAYTFSKGRTD